MDLGGWLRSLGLERYEAAFRENELDETLLPSLTHETLKELGVTAVGHRLKLLDAIAALRTHGATKPSSADEATAPAAPSVTSEDRAERRQVTRCVRRGRFQRAGSGPAGRGERSGLARGRSRSRGRFPCYLTQCTGTRYRGRSSRLARHRRQTAGCPGIHCRRDAAVVFMPPSPTAAGRRVHARGMVPKSAVF